VNLHPSQPGRSARTRGLLAATMLAVAVSALACGSGEQSDLTPLRSLQVRAAGHLPQAGDGDGDDPFDIDRPTIGKLDPDLLHALQAAARDAQSDGVGLRVNSGWRSRAHQRRLFAEAVRRYGGEDEARRYVASPDASAHVTGDAVDIGPAEADDWLAQHGADYGLCQIFANEIWHFELATVPGGRCPDMYADSSRR
jgi:D-alanyl-D-alanine carboxypeptidase